MRRGATGEVLVGNILADLPDDFCVINDLTTPFGNLDHAEHSPARIQPPKLIHETVRALFFRADRPHRFWWEGANRSRS